MTPYLAKLAERRRFGMRPGLDAMRRLCGALGSPELGVRAIHIAGTNGKGAVAAILDAALRAAGFRTMRYTSPHLVRLNERFCLDGVPAPDALLDAKAAEVERASAGQDTTFFEALTAVAFLVAAETKPDFAILETGLGGRLDATNVCSPELTVITRIGLDHCDWLGGTVPEIAAEKAGIAKPGVPLVVGANLPEALAALKRRARDIGAPFVYAPDVAADSEIPASFSLAGTFNRENAVTALAALKTLFPCGDTPQNPGDTPPIFSGDRPQNSGDRPLCKIKKQHKNTLFSQFIGGFSNIIWPGRFQRVGSFLIDGAHNPPAAHALVAALRQCGDSPCGTGDSPHFGWNLIAGFCGDKDVDEVLRILAPLIRRGYAVRTANPRSLTADVVAQKMKSAVIDAIPCNSLKNAILLAGSVPTKMGSVPNDQGGTVPTLICGSLFLAGEALVELGVYPWGLSPESGGGLSPQGKGGLSPVKIDPAEVLRTQ